MALPPSYGNTMSHPIYYIHTLACDFVRKVS